MNNVGRLVFLAFVVAFALIFAFHTMAQTSRETNVNRRGVAIRGYDPVAYFTVGEAVEGDPGITAEHHGATYQFSTPEHRDLFVASPDEYLPEYGGWCAYAMASGSFARIDPEAWVIHDGRLFLNFSRRINQRFLGDLEGYIERADAEWPTAAR